MIAIDLNRLAMIQPKKGDILLNEDEQKFIVTVSTTKALFCEPYEGKRKPTLFAYTGNLAQSTD